jgi:hypothetical protein
MMMGSVWTVKNLTFNMNLKPTEIPDMKDPLGRYWDQPDKSEILIDEECAVMTLATKNKLANYATSTPSGVYAGKMYQRDLTGWTKDPGPAMLCFMFEVAEDPGYIYTRKLPILLIE